MARSADRRVPDLRPADGASGRVLAPSVTIDQTPGLSGPGVIEMSAPRARWEGLHISPTQLAAAALAPPTPQHGEGVRQVRPGEPLRGSLGECGAACTAQPAGLQGGSATRQAASGPRATARQQGPAARWRARRQAPQQPRAFSQGAVASTLRAHSWLPSVPGRGLAKAHMHWLAAARHPLPPMQSACMLTGPREHHRRVGHVRPGQRQALQRPAGMGADAPGRARSASTWAAQAHIVRLSDTT